MTTEFNNWLTSEKENGLIGISVFSIEAAFDEIRARIGKLPLEERLKLHKKIATRWAKDFMQFIKSPVVTETETL